MHNNLTLCKSPSIERSLRSCPMYYRNPAPHSWHMSDTWCNSSTYYIRSEMRYCWQLSMIGILLAIMSHLNVDLVSRRCLTSTAWALSWAWVSICNLVNSVVVSEVSDGVCTLSIHIVIYVCFAFKNYACIDKENDCKEGWIDRKLRTTRK